MYVLKNEKETLKKESLFTIRTIPSHVSCDRYANGGHGWGMPQVASYVLAASGRNDTRNSPSQGAIVPEDINAPWSAEDILSYFYPNTILEKYNE